VFALFTWWLAKFELRLVDLRRFREDLHSHDAVEVRFEYPSAEDRHCVPYEIDLSRRAERISGTASPRLQIACPGIGYLDLWSRTVCGRVEQHYLNILPLLRARHHDL